MITSATSGLEHVKRQHREHIQLRRLTLFVVGEPATCCALSRDASAAAVNCSDGLVVQRFLLASGNPCSNLVDGFYLLLMRDRLAHLDLLGTFFLSGRAFAKREKVEGEGAWLSWQIVFLLPYHLVMQTGGGMSGRC